ncbi:MAG: DUF3256 family protein [Paludibacteraceae bacterium]|nr:DUF3256 family protein [Paludibacteraceae bacterium]
MRRISLLIIAWLCSFALWAEANVVKQLLLDISCMGGAPEVLQEEGPYVHIQLTDSTSLEMFQGDSIIVVTTVCAPQCSSCAQVYNKEWQLVQTLTPPTPSIFPLATIDPKTGKVMWKDNDTWEY